MRAVLVHGFNVKDKGEHTVDRLAHGLRLAGFELDMDEGDYGYFGLFSIRWFDGERRGIVLSRLARAFECADLVVTHSNGAHFTNQAMRLLPPAYNRKLVVVNISPAMNRRTEPTMATKAELNLCTPRDFWVRLSSWLLFHPWGRRGAKGYKGKSSIVQNEFHPEVKGHSDWFNDEHRSMTLAAIGEFWRSKQ